LGTTSGRSDLFLFRNWLVGQNDRHQPVRILESDEPSRAGLIAGELGLFFKESWITERTGESVVVKHPAAAGNIAIFRRAGSIQAVASIAGLFKNRYVPAGEMGVPDQIGGCGQRGDAGTDEVSFDPPGVLFKDAFRTEDHSTTSGVISLS
jgi:hypothetical protein